MKDKEWLKEEIKVDLGNLNWKGKLTDIDASNLRGGVNHLIDQLEEPETISDQFLKNHSDWVTLCHTGEKVLAVRCDVLRDVLVPKVNEPEITEEQAWDLISNKYGSENLVRLHKKYLEREGYIVEKKEKLYTVCFEDKKNPYKTGIFLYKQDGKVNSGNAMDNYYPKDSESHLTEKEIKDYDEKFWQFAVPVEEVTE